MRALICVVLMLAAPSPAWSETIGDVLQRSQLQRLDGYPPADAGSPQARRVRQSFELLTHEVRWQRPVRLQIVDDPDLRAETLVGRVVVAGTALGALPEAERLFILAHELGHVALDHWSQMGLLFQKWVPGSVTQQQTDAVAPLLGRDASSLAHRQELEADAFAMRLLDRMGRTREEVIGVFAHAGMRRDTPTHPGSARRSAALMQVDLSADMPAEAPVVHGTR